MTDREFEQELSEYCELFKSEVRLARMQAGAQVVLTTVLGPYGNLALSHVQPPRKYIRQLASGREREMR